MEEEKRENEPSSTCTYCGRWYEERDFDFQSCSNCGWDEENEIFNPKIKRGPGEANYMNGDADILTGEWI